MVQSIPPEKRTAIRAGSGEVAVERRGTGEIRCLMDSRRAERRELMASAWAKEGIGGTAGDGMGKSEDGAVVLTRENRYVYPISSCKCQRIHQETRRAAHERVRE